MASIYNKADKLFMDLDLIDQRLKSIGDTKTELLLLSNKLNTAPFGDGTNQSSGPVAGNMIEFNACLKAILNEMADLVGNTHDFLQQQKELIIKADSSNAN